MPTIECSKRDLLDLIGEDLTDSELEDVLTRVKVEVEEIDGDRIEVEITSDRIDLLSPAGIARSVRSFLEKQTGLTDYQIHDSDYEITVEDVPARPHIVTAVVRGVDMDTETLQSLIQLQEKLHGTFGRDRERVSIGVHDMRQLTFPLTYKDAAPDEYSFIPLEKDREMTLQEILDEHEKGKQYADVIKDFDRWPIIVDDADRVLSFPPIINGRVTEVSTASEDLFIDITGTDPDSLKYALNVLVTALAERGGEIHSVTMHTPDGRQELPRLESDEREVDLDYISQVVGVDFSQEQARDHLEKMGYGVVEIGDQLQILAPSYRADILHQIDIAEDVAIGYGYNNIEPELPDIATIGQEDDIEKFMHTVRDLMTGFGYQEVMNPTLTDDATLGTKPGRDLDSAVRIANPVSEQYVVGRDTLLPQLLDTLANNTHNEYPQQIFEAADVIRKDDQKTVKARTDRFLAAVTAAQDAGFNDLKAELQGLAESLDVDLDYVRASQPPFIDGRCARLELDGEQVGFIGEIDPEALENFGVEMPVAAFELDLETFYNHAELC